MLSYVFAAIGVACTLGGILHAQGFRKRHADTGDFTGAALLESFLMFDVVPLTLVALTTAIWLLPTRAWFKRRTDRVEGTLPESRSPAATDLRPINAVLLVMFAIGYLGLVWHRTGIRSFPSGPLTDGGMLVLALFFLPTIIMAIVLLLAAWRLARSRP